MSELVPQLCIPDYARTARYLAALTTIFIAAGGVMASCGKSEGGGGGGGGNAGGGGGGVSVPKSSGHGGYGGYNTQPRRGDWGRNIAPLLGGVYSSGIITVYIEKPAP